MLLRARDARHREWNRESGKDLKSRNLPAKKHRAGF
jgi:hypothetical protein